jgi:hypothetical protein
MGATTKQRRAYLAEWDGVRSIVPAATRGQAIATVMRSATECGYKPEWQQVRAARAPQYDAWAAQAVRQCWSEEYVRELKP